MCLNKCKMSNTELFSTIHLFINQEKQVFIHSLKCNQSWIVLVQFYCSVSRISVDFNISETVADGYMTISSVSTVRILL